MKVIVNGEAKTLSAGEILAMATGADLDDCKSIAGILARLKTAERDRDFWRDRAIETQQKLEALEKNVTE